ncbi:fasciclin domain-containing protein [Nibrella saemangeumensis]|uniref:Fasciclin domain-containing protein n=1 Tax=Nibrella saemangeumensis TaxID=1084526 RepID=A0ABP8MVD1_9BACT
MIRSTWKVKATLLTLLVATVTVLTSCNNDDDDDTVQPQTITDIVVNDNNFTLLEAAVVRAGLADALRQGNLTVFAPTDAAFRAAGYNDVAAINALPVNTLQSVLQYHVLNQRVNAAAIPTAANTAQPSLLTTNGTLYITKDNSGVTVNGARVSQADIAASNGVIHVIDRVLMPPTGDLVALAQGNPNFSLLVAAVLRAGTPVINALSGQQALTVFAPTNAAFQAAGFANEAAINAANPATLASILTYHVVPGRVFSSNIQNGMDVTTAQGTTIRTAVNGNTVTVLGRGNNNTAANITAANMLATNGVVHVIDRVLVPAP